MKLNIKAFAVAAAVVYGFAIFGYTWWLIFRGKFLNEEGFLNHIYPFYRVSPLGSFIGLLYGAFDGLIFGAILAWVYNQLC